MNRKRNFLFLSVCKNVGSPSTSGRYQVCCDDLAGTCGAGLVSPVGFNSFDITYQVLSEADAKNLGGEKATGHIWLQVTTSILKTAGTV